MKKFKLILIIISLIFMYCKEEKISQDNAKYIDPFIGTGAHGHTYPGATLPFGMFSLYGFEIFYKIFGFRYI